MTMDDKHPADRTLMIRSNIMKLQLSANLAGYLDSETVPQLKEFLARASTDMSAGIARDFEFDTAHLYLMSSSAISCFAGWVKTVVDRFPESRITFRTNRNLTWQQRALEPIRRLAPQTVVID